MDGRELGLVGVALEGLIVGFKVGIFNGDTVGVNEGNGVGLLVGTLDGIAVGTALGGSGNNTTKRFTTFSPFVTLILTS